MNKLSLAAIGFSTSLLVSGMALAAGDEKAQFEALDLNQDGLLTADEVASDPDLSQKWSQIDADASGDIDRVEFSAFEEVEGADQPEPTEGTGAN